MAAMTAVPISPRILKGGLILLDPTTSAVQRVIALQYNPESLSRSLQIRGAGTEGGDRTEALRLTGPPIETIKLDAELDAADQLEAAEKGDSPTELSLHPQLAALETVVYPRSSELAAHKTQAQGGVMEIAPMEAPLVLFVWSAERVVPVRITELSITEEAFDPFLNPIRAKVSLGMRVLSADDLGFDHKGASVFTIYHKNKERLATLSRGSDLKTTFGIKGIP